VVLILVDDDLTESDYILPHLEEVVTELIMFFDFARKGNWDYFSVLVLEPGQEVLTSVVQALKLLLSVL
jgi:hypothetical protein